MMQQVKILLEQYKQLNLSSTIDHDKFNHFAITHHSTTIEGSTLTETETRLLLDEGLTPKGKPLLHSLMVQDHYKALLFIAEMASKEQVITSSFIQEVNAKAMRQTGSLYQTVFGEIDASQGMFRKGNVRAGNSYFVSFDKVEALVQKLVTKINEQLPQINDIEAQLNLSFDVHFDLVSIHPFYDGNGRTSRLLMNYLQLLFKLPMAIVFKEDKADYFEALEATRKQESIDVFRMFMCGQYAKMLNNEIAAYQAMQNNNGSKGKGFSLVF